MIGPSKPHRETPLHWVGSAKKDLLAFPDEVIGDFGYALGLVQLGGVPPSAKPWKGEGPGVFELIEDHRGDTFRVAYTVRFEDAVRCTYFTASRRSHLQASGRHGPICR